MFGVKRAVKAILAGILILSLSSCEYRVSSVETSTPVSLSDVLSESKSSVRHEDEDGLQNSDNYFAKNGIGVEAEPCFLETKAVSFRNDDPSEQEIVTVTFEVQSITIERDAEDPETKSITLELEASMRSRYSAKDKNAWRAIFCDAVFDLYTGRVLPCADLEGDFSCEGMMTIDYKGKMIDLFYKRTNDWNWILLEENNQVLYCCDIIYKIKAPAEYDGLVFGAIAQTQYLPDVQKNILTEEDFCVADFLREEGYDLSQSAFFRFGQNASENESGNEE